MSTPTYVLVDGENIDATLGMSVLGRRPNPEERPRWDRILAFADELNGALELNGEGARGGDPDNPATESRVRGLFFLNASSGQLPMGFIQALLALGYTPIPLASDGDEKVVDVGIQRTLEAIGARDSGNVLLASHDGDFIPQVQSLLNAGRRVGMLCFREFLNSKLAELTSRGLEIFDLETDIGAFTTRLPRIRVITLDEFDPRLYL